MTFRVAYEDRRKLLSRIEENLIWLENFAKTELNTVLETLLLEKSGAEERTRPEGRR